MVYHMCLRLSQHKVLRLVFEALQRTIHRETNLYENTVFCFHDVQLPRLFQEWNYQYHTAHFEIPIGSVLGVSVTRLPSMS